MEIGAKQYDKEGTRFWTSKRKKKQARKNGPPQYWSSRESQVRPAERQRAPKKKKQGLHQFGFCVLSDMHDQPKPGDPMANFVFFVWFGFFLRSFVCVSLSLMGLDYVQILYQLSFVAICFQTATHVNLQFSVFAEIERVKRKP